MAMPGPIMPPITPGPIPIPPPIMPPPGPIIPGPPAPEPGGRSAGAPSPRGGCANAEDNAATNKAAPARNVVVENLRMLASVTDVEGKPACLAASENKIQTRIKHNRAAPGFFDAHQSYSAAYRVISRERRGVRRWRFSRRGGNRAAGGEDIRRRPPTFCPNRPTDI